MHTDTTRENPQAVAPQAAESSQDLAATAPGQLRVIKRNGTVVPYTDDKITVAITKAFLAVEGGTAAASSRIHETVARLTEQVTATFKRRMPSGGTIHIEEIQDQVELALMRAGEQKVARDYVIYREAQAAKRKNSADDWALGANIADARGDYPEALSRHREALQHEPNGQHYYNAAGSAQKAGDKQQSPKDETRKKGGAKQ